MNLADYAVSLDASSRKYPQRDDPWRNGFQRDRDRVLHCSAFRRLDFKTQVFVPHEHDHFRTRLTHSLEVAQVGRDIGRALKLNEDLIEATALAHDLGHPPFGHIGEKVLDQLMADDGHFEHNRQSLRVVDYLEHPYPDFRGLNLTDMTRVCLAKHETRYDSPAGEEFLQITSAPLEGQLVDLADEIAYTSADLEDALASGWITIEDLSTLDIWQRAWEAVSEEYPTARDIHKRIRATKQILTIMVTDVITSSQKMISSLDLHSCDDAMNSAQKAICFSPDVIALISPLQEMLMARVYKHEKNLKQERLAGDIINSLFEFYLTKPDKLPARYLKRVENSEDSLQRVICDYIAGMTDRYCRDEFDKLEIEN